MNKFTGKIKKIFFDTKRRTIITTIALLLVSFGIGYFVLAEDDVLANQMTITNASVVVKDGISDVWDSDNQAGNDSSNNNKIVRNFDTIEYQVSFKLAYKGTYNGEHHDSNTRNVEIHFYAPNGFNNQINSNIEGSVSSLDTDVIEGYKHYVITKRDVTISSDASSNTISVYFPVVYGKNGQKILPKIKIKEATDETALSSISDNLTSSSTVTVSAKENYAIKLYPGTVKKEAGNMNSTIPVGVLIYLPEDSVKGIKGIQVPESINFDMNIKYSQGSGTIDTSTYEISNYDHEKQNVANLPDSYEKNNAKAGVAIKNANSGYVATAQISYTEIKYNTGTINLNEGTDLDENNVTYISSKVFTVDVSKNDKSDTKLVFSANDTSGKVNSNIEIIDNYIPIVGEYQNKIDFIDASNITVNTGDEIKFTTPGEAIYNYNEEFYIQNTIKYAENQGDTLEKGLTNYIKVDNDFVRLIDATDSTGYYTEMTSSNDKQDNTSFNVSFGIGRWEASYFKLKSDRPSYCPSSVPTDKNQLMNMYGGPCIEEETSKFKWENVESIDEIDEQDQNNIIVFKYDFTGEYYPATQTIIRLKGHMVSNTNNVGKTTQVISRGITTDFNNKTYYLSDTAGKSVSVQDADLNYIKSEYDATNKKIIEGTNSPSGKFGNSILVTPFKANINTVEILDSYDSLKNEIYSGITDPLSININTVINKADADSTITGATLTIYLPTELEIDIQKTDRIPSEMNFPVESIDGKTYNKFVYKYTEDEIKYGDYSGSIDNLVLHAYIDISTLDNTEVTIISTIDASMKTNKTAVEDYSSAITPIESRTNRTNIILRNTKVIGTLGKVSPTYFDRNSIMTYNMRAANLSGSNTNLTLLKILPYNGDGLSEGSSYKGSISLKLNEMLPSGYQIYYSKANPNTIISNELNSSSLNGWVLWANYTSNISDITAIKITGPSIANGQYFASKSGINISMQTAENDEGDEYYNNFYMLQVGKIKCDNEVEGGCTQTSDNSVTPYASNISYSSVYNRSISGYVFEDYDYDGFYSNSENRLSNIPIEVYKVSSTNIENKKDPLSVISENDELIAEATTNKNGSYKIKGLAQGNYYVKYTFDCDKYTVTEKNKQNLTSVNTSDIDSDASMVANTCTAVSNILTLNNENIEQNHIDLGLRIRQNFDVTIKKYITNVTVNSTKGTESHDYNNETKVKIDVKNLKNTSFRVTYKFVIENSKYFPGTIGQIIESIPEGMTFDPSLPENDGWYKSGDYLYYMDYAKTYILPDEKYYMTVVLDLKTDNGGDYLNVIAAQDLKIMDPSVNLLEGIQISDYNPKFDTNSTNGDE